MILSSVFDTWQRNEECEKPNAKTAPRLAGGALLRMSLMARSV